MHQIAEQPACTFNVLDCHFFKLNHLKSWSRIRDRLAETPLFQPQEMPAHRDRKCLRCFSVEQSAGPVWPDVRCICCIGTFNGAAAPDMLQHAAAIYDIYDAMSSMLATGVSDSVKLVIVGQSGPSRMTFSAGNTKSFPEAQLGGVLHFSSPPQRHC